MSFRTHRKAGILLLFFPLQEAFRIPQRAKRQADSVWGIPQAIHPVDMDTKRNEAASVPLKNDVVSNEYGVTLTSSIFDKGGLDVTSLEEDSISRINEDVHDLVHYPFFVETGKHSSAESLKKESLKSRMGVRDFQETLMEKNRMASAMADSMAGAEAEVTSRTSNFAAGGLNDELRKMTHQEHDSSLQEIESMSTNNALASANAKKKGALASVDLYDRTKQAATQKMKALDGSLSSKGGRRRREEEKEDEKEKEENEEEEGEGGRRRKRGRRKRVKCDPGSYHAEGNSSCSICSGGQYSSEPGATACSDCTSGKYSGKPGNTACIPCSSGSFSRDSRSTSCESCDSGKYSSDTGGSSCTSCPAGEYAADAGSSACLSCSLLFTSDYGANECRVAIWPWVITVVVVVLVVLVCVKRWASTSQGNDDDKTIARPSPNDDKTTTAPNAQTTKEITESPKEQFKNCPKHDSGFVSSTSIAPPPSDTLAASSSRTDKTLARPPPNDDDETITAPNTETTEEIPKSLKEQFKNRPKYDGGFVSSTSIAPPSSDTLAASSLRTTGHGKSSGQGQVTMDLTGGRINPAPNLEQPPATVFGSIVPFSTDTLAASSLRTAGQGKSSDQEQVTMDLTGGRVNPAPNIEQPPATVFASIVPFSTDTLTAPSLSTAGHGRSSAQGQIPRLSRSGFTTMDLTVDRANSVSNIPEVDKETGQRTTVDLTREIDYPPPTSDMTYDCDLSRIAS